MDLYVRMIKRQIRVRHRLELQRVAPFTSFPFFIKVQLDFVWRIPLRFKWPTDSVKELTSVLRALQFIISYSFSKSVPPSFITLSTQGPPYKVLLIYYLALILRELPNRWHHSIVIDFVLQYLLTIGDQSSPKYGIDHQSKAINGSKRIVHLQDREILHTLVQLLHFKPKGQKLQLV